MRPGTSPATGLLSPPGPGPWSGGPQPHRHPPVGGAGRPVAMHPAAFAEAGRDPPGRQPEPCRSVCRMSCRPRRRRQADDPDAPGDVSTGVALATGRFVAAADIRRRWIPPGGSGRQTADGGRGCAAARLDRHDRHRHGDHDAPQPAPHADIHQRLGLPPDSEVDPMPGATAGPSSATRGRRRTAAGSAWRRGAGVRRPKNAPPPH